MFLNSLIYFNFAKNETPLQMQIDETPRGMLRREGNLETDDQLSELLTFLSIAAANTDSDNDTIITRFDVDDDLVSTRSGSLVSAENATIMAQGRIKNRSDVTLSRAIMQIARGDIAGMSLPDFTLIPLEQELPDSNSTVLELMVAGDVNREGTVWHEISSAYTLLTGVNVEFNQLTKCNFCPVSLLVGTPVIQLKHVCTFEATDQHIQLKIGISCRKCAKRRGVPIELAPLMKVGWIFLEERLTIHMRYVVSGMRDIIDNFLLHVEDPLAACDECFTPLKKGEDFLVVVARRKDYSELAIFPVCSENCKEKLQRSLQNATSASIMCPRPNGVHKLETNLTLLSGMTRTKSSLPDVSDVPAAEWHILNDVEFRELAKNGLNGSNSTNANRGTIIHRCQSVGCFCKDTHRGMLYKQYHSKLQSKQAILPPHYVLQNVYERLLRVHLYVDILGSDAQARCIVCKKPAALFCIDCRAVRLCGENCKQKATEHRLLCRPYNGAWTALEIV